MSQDVTSEHLKLMAEKGITITAPDAKFRAELEPIGATLTAEWLKKAGQAGEQIIAAYRKQ